MSEIVTIGSSGTGTKEGRFLTYATVAGGLVFTTGSRGYDPATFDPGTESGVLPPDLADEARFAFQRQREVLHQANSDIDRLLKVTIFVNSEDSKDLDLVRRTFDEFLAQNGVDRPPATCISMGRLAVGRLSVDVVATADLQLHP